MRLIDADNLVPDICDAEIEYGTKPVHFSANAIDLAPTVDAVLVVRCRECKKHSEANGKHYCKFWRMYCPDDSEFFCKAGERKEGAD